MSEDEHVDAAAGDDTNDSAGGGIVYASCTEGGYEVLRYLLDEGVSITRLVSLTPEQGERYSVAGYQSFDGIAEDHDLPVYYPETYELDESDQATLRGYDERLLVVNGWQRLVPGAVLESFERGALGVHGSAYGLPEGRGRSPLNWSLIEDLDRFLLSVIRLDETADSGDIAGTVKFDISPHDDIRTLYYKTAVATQRILAATLDDILAGTHEFRSQAGTPTYYHKREPEDGAINWKNPTHEVYNLVRAVARPYPGAFTAYEGERVIIWEAMPFSDDFRFEADPGTVVRTFETTGEFVVKTADGTLLVTDWEAPSSAWTPERGMKLASLGPRNRVDTPEETS